VLLECNARDASLAGLRESPVTRPRFWTNESALALAGPDGDPVAVVTERARAEAMRAMEEGWSGPPFDPFELAERLGVPLVPRVELADARAVPRGVRGVRIEFNPTRPRGRLRFSIAHELAHTFFPDADRRVRNRGGTRAGDDWQLELLCNIAASELLMPIGSFPELKDADLDIKALMQLRRDYEVSTEALLRRVVFLSDRPITFFSASRLDGDRVDSRFRIEYWVRSRQWEAPLLRGMLLPRDTVLRHCSAIGFTDAAVESWGRALAKVHVQSAGVSPYPGQTFPRVVGLLEARGTRSRASHRVHYVDGDATKPRGDGQRIIAHVVNDATPNWGGPFARALKGRYGSAQAEFKGWAEGGKPSTLALGNVHFTELDGLTIATMIAQHGYGHRRPTRLSYVALRACLEQVAERATRLGAAVHMPRIGAGEARGRWDIISELIDVALIERDVQVTVYTLPGAVIEEPTQQALTLKL
jgi:hypothetical protein